MNNDYRSVGDHVQALYEQHLDELWEASQRRYPKKRQVQHRPGVHRKGAKLIRPFTCWSCGKERANTNDNCPHCNAVDFPF